MSQAVAAPDHHLKGVLLVGGAAVLWSLGGLIVRSLDTDSWTTIFWRSVFATAFLFLFLLVRDGRGAFRLFRDMGLPGLVLGLCFTAASVGFVTALAFASVAQTLVIMSSAPLVAAVMGRIVLGERISPIGYVAIVGVMAGIALMMSDDFGADQSLIGGLIAFAIAVSLAGSVVIVRRWPHIRMTPATCTGAAAAMLVSLPFATPLAVGAADFGLLAFFGAGQLGVGLILLVTGARLIPAVLSSLLGMLEPILGPAWVWLLLGEEPTTMTLVGGAIVVASVAAYTISMTWRRGGR
ncbi:MAG: DMT family transporter [Rhizobiales bacterium]|nr:DMT family transporter [Hyphomicrobiales bacterium]